ncbi:MAG: ATP-binding protein [Deltaproteobacteria bacterium]|nr:ATP-binding protein [Deltaproteobacteria bacterium]
MIELSLHVLDIAENSTRAGAKNVYITIVEDTLRDRLSLEIRDDGEGMSRETLERAMDPFFTSKKVRRVGLGLPMLAQAAEQAGGSLKLESELGKGTLVRVEFQLSHIDRQPLGDMAGTLATLIAGNGIVDFIYSHRRDDREFLLDTHEIRSELEDVPITHVEVLNYIRRQIKEGLKEIEAIP